MENREAKDNKEPKKVKKRKKRFGFRIGVVSLLVIAIAALILIGFKLGGGNLFGVSSEKQDDDNKKNVVEYSVELTKDNKIIFNNKEMNSVNAMITELQEKAKSDNAESFTVRIIDKDAVADKYDEVKKSLNQANINFYSDSEGKK